MKHLTELQINGSGLQILPSNFGSLEKLKIFGCRENSLQILPDSFCFLKNLEELDLGENILSHLPEKFGYIISRLVSFIDPSKGDKFQSSSALDAIKLGGLTGQGMGAVSYTHLRAHET